MKALVSIFGIYFLVSASVFAEETEVGVLSCWKKASLSARLDCLAFTRTQMDTFEREIPVFSSHEKCSISKGNSGTWLMNCPVDFSIPAGSKVAISGKYIRVTFKNPDSTRMDRFMGLNALVYSLYEVGYLNKEGEIAIGYTYLSYLE